MMCAMLLLAIPVNLHAQTLTLACEGKVNTGGDHSEAVHNMGIVVDLTAGTVSGFGGVVVPIARVDAATVSFNGTANASSFQGLPRVQVSVWGDIDRVTGVVTATQSSKALSLDYDLICKTARRLF